MYTNFPSKYYIKVYIKKNFLPKSVERFQLNCEYFIDSVQ